MLQNIDTRNPGNVPGSGLTQEIENPAVHGRHSSGTSVTRCEGKKLIPAPLNIKRPDHTDTQTARVVEARPQHRRQPSASQTAIGMKPVYQDQISPTDLILQQQVFTLAKQGQWNEVEKKIRSLKPNLLKSEIDGHLIHLAAAKSGSLEVLTYLVSIKGQINLIDKHGHTPVMIAFKNNRGWITIDTLLSAKPDPTIRDPDTRMNLLRLVIGAGYYNHFVTLGQAHSELVWQLDIDQTSPVAKAMEMGLITRTIAEKLFGHDNAACHDKTPKHRAISAYSRQSGQPDPIAARRKQSAATVQQDLKTGKQVDEAFWEKIKKAAPTNNKEEIRSLYANRNEHCFDEKYGRYDHVAFISIMDDKKRLEHTLFLYPPNYKADLHLWSVQNPSEDDHLIKTTKKLTSNSKLIIDGHGPLMAKMSGGDFAFRLNNLLNDHCIDNQTPRITLTGCKPAHATKNLSFAEELSKTLALLNRETKITAATEKIFFTSNGTVLCAKTKIDKNSCHRVECWQGESTWLSPVTQKYWGFCNITSENRRTDLIKVLSTEPHRTRTRTVIQNKYEIQGAPGLQSLIPGIVQK